MLIQNLEQKTRLAFATVLVAVAGSVALSVFTIWTCISMVSGERNQVYVLDGDIPFIAERIKMEENFTLEAKAHIASFHQYFFTLPPDDDYIDWTLGKAMYLADNSALRQKQLLEEKGFYNDLISSSAMATLVTDSIKFDESTRQFSFYGTQVIRRRSRIQRRAMTTTGTIEIIERTINNPHGLLVSNWKVLDNTDIK